MKVSDLLHLINTVWTNFYSTFPTYHGAITVAQICCSVMALYCAHVFSEGLSVLMRFLCVTAFFPVFFPPGNFFNHPLYELPATDA